MKARPKSTNGTGATNSHNLTAATRTKLSYTRVAHMRAQNIVASNTKHPCTVVESAGSCSVDPMAKCDVHTDKRLVKTRDEAEARRTCAIILRSRFKECFHAVSNVTWARCALRQQTHLHCDASGSGIWK